MAEGVKAEKMKSIVETLIGGGRTGSRVPEAPRTLADRMFEGNDKNLTMKTRLNARMVGAVGRAKMAAKLVKFDPLADYADLLMQLHVSLDGKGRAESVDMARVTAITQIGGANGFDSNLEG